MTREEAIEVIKQDIPCEHDTDVIEALKMAIQALSQEPTFDDECQKDMDEAWEQIQKKRKRIPVTLDLTPCDDAISRDAVLDAIEHEDKWLLDAKGHNGLTEIAFSGLKARVDALPSVTQSGKWIDRQFQSKIDGEIRNGWECSECGERFFRYDLVNTDEFIPKYCPNCGCRMFEPQESEDKE